MERKQQEEEVQGITEELQELELVIPIFYVELILIRLQRISSTS